MSMSGNRMNFQANLRIKTLLISSGLLIGLAGTGAVAQVAPPPTEPAKEHPEYVPAPAPKPAAKPARPANTVSAKKNDGSLASLPNTPHPPLAQLGPDGRILRLRQLPDILALRSNPNVGPGSVEKIMPIIYSRRYKIEQMVIDNLDLYLELTGGLIENFDLADMGTMGRIAQMLKPLVPPTTLSQELLNRGILTRIQGQFNQKIVADYKRAITDEIQVLDDENSLDNVMRFVLDDSIQEASLAYTAMLAESSYQIAGLVEKAGLTSEQALELSLLEKPLNTDIEQQFLDIRVFDLAFRELSYDEGMLIFRTMIEQRKFPSISPMIKTINVLHDRKKVMKGDGFNIKTKTGNEIKPIKEQNIKAEEKAAKQSKED